MMRRLVTLFMLTFTAALWFGGLVIAEEDDEVCGPADIRTRTQELIDAYNADLENVQDSAAALEIMQTLRDALDAIVEECESFAAMNRLGDTDPGNGTMRSPYAFGIAGDTGEGFSLQVTGYIRPGDAIIRNENMFNDRPGEGEVYIIIGLVLGCYENTSTCEADSFDFSLVGDAGIIYDVPFVVYDEEFDVNVLGGTTADGNLPFLVREDDTNLRLIFSPFLSNRSVYYYAEPSLANGIEVQSSTNLNVRGGPGTNYGVVGNLPPETPVTAFGRNSDGSWLQIPSGWVFADLLTINGDVEDLPVTTAR